MTSQNLLRSGKQRQALFSERGEIASHATKVESSWPAAETAGDLLLDCEHADVALSLRIVKGDTQIPHEGQDGLFVLRQSIEQVPSWTLLATPAPFRFRLGWWGRVSLLTHLEQQPRAAEHLFLEGRSQHALWFLPGVPCASLAFAIRHFLVATGSVRLLLSCSYFLDFGPL